MRTMPAPMTLLVGCAVILATSCGDASTSPGFTRVVVQVVDLIPTSVYLMTGGLKFLPQSGIFCLSVDPASPSVTVRASAGDSVLGTFTPTVQERGTHSVFMYPDSTGATQFVAVASGFVPPAGSGGIRLFNATRSAQDLYLTDVLTNGMPNTLPLMRDLGAGVASGYVSVPPGQHYFLTVYAGTTVRSAVWGPVGIVGGSNMTLTTPDLAGANPASYTPDCTGATIGSPP